MEIRGTAAAERGWLTSAAAAADVSQQKRVGRQGKIEMMRRSKKIALPTVLNLLLFALFAGVGFAANVTYTVVQEKISDTAIKTQIEQHMVVEGVPSKAELEAEILKRYRSALSRRGFRYYNPATNIFIYVYATREQALAGQGLWIAMIGKGFSDKAEPKVLVNEQRLASLSQPPEDHFGLSEPMRQQVFREIAAAEQQGTREAMARVPDSRIMEQIDLERELQKKYKTEVARKYKLAADQIANIAVEGVKKGWPSR